MSALRTGPFLTFWRTFHFVLRNWIAALTFVEASEYKCFLTHWSLSVKSPPSLDLTLSIITFFTKQEAKNKSTELKNHCTQWSLTLVFINFLRASTLFPFLAHPYFNSTDFYFTQLSKSKMRRCEYYFDYFWWMLTQSNRISRNLILEPAHKEAKRTSHRF